MGLKTFTNLFQAVGTVGLTGLDRLYSFMNVRLLQRFTDVYRRMVRTTLQPGGVLRGPSKSFEGLTGGLVVRSVQIKSEKGLNPFLEAFAAELEPISSLPANSMRLYANALAKSAKLFAVFAEHVTSLGHIQLVRKMIGNELTVRGDRTTSAKKG